MRRDILFFEVSVIVLLSGFVLFSGCLTQVDESQNISVKVLPADTHPKGLSLVPSLYPVQLRYEYVVPFSIQNNLDAPKYNVQVFIHGTPMNKFATTTGHCEEIEATIVLRYLAPLGTNSSSITFDQGFDKCDFDYSIHVVSINF